MSAEPREPGIEIESWIDKGESPRLIGRLKGQKGTGDRAHFEFTHVGGGPEWVKAYAEGREPFRDLYVAKAREFSAGTQAAQAVIATRIALDIPWRGGRFFHDQGTVAKAMGYGDTWEIAWSTPDGAMESLRLNHKGMQEAFDSPYSLKEEMWAIAHQGREAIKGRESEEWSKAVTYFNEQGDSLAAGVGAIELAEVYKTQNQPEEAASSYTAAIELLHRRKAEIYQSGATVGNTAQLDEIGSYTHHCGNMIIDLLKYKRKVSELEKGFLKLAVGTVYETGWMSQDLLQGYKILARSSSRQERKQYKPVIKRIAEVIRPPDFIVGGEM